MSRTALRRPRPATRLIACALTLAVAPLAVADGAGAGATPFITFSRSTVRPGQTITITYGGLRPDRAVVCVWGDGDLIVCTTTPTPSGTDTATFMELFGGVQMLGFKVRYEIYSPSDIVNGVPAPSAIPIDSERFRLVLAPMAPTIRSLTRGEGKIRVITDAPRADFGSSVSGYQTRCVGGGGTFVSDSSIDGRSVVTDLPNQVAFRCSSRAKNARGWSIWGRPRTMTTSTRPPAAPSAPRTVDIGVVDATQPVDVQLGKPADTHGGTITAYQARCVNGDTVRTSTPTRTTRQRVTGLTPNTEWACSGRARNTVGWSDWSAALTVVVPAAT